MVHAGGRVHAGGCQWCMLGRPHPTPTYRPCPGSACRSRRRTLKCRTHGQERPAGSAGRGASGLEMVVGMVTGRGHLLHGPPPKRGSRRFCSRCLGLATTARRMSQAVCVGPHHEPQNAGVRYCDARQGDGKHLCASRHTLSSGSCQATGVQDVSLVLPLVPYHLRVPSQRAHGIGIPARPRQH